MNPEPFCLVCFKLLPEKHLFFGVRHLRQLENTSKPVILFGFQVIMISNNVLISASVHIYTISFVKKKEIFH